MEEHTKAVLDGLRKLKHDDGVYGFTLYSSTGKGWKVHKVVLSMHSDVLYRMSTSEDFVECQERRATLKDVENRCIDAMVDYFYHPKTCLSEYISQASVENDESSPSIAEHMTFFADAVLLADMYHVKGLKSWATECFKEWFHEERDIKWIDRALDTFDEQDNMPDWIWDAMVRAVVRVLDMSHEYTVAETTSLFTKHPKLPVAIANDMAARNFVGTYDNEAQPNDGQSDDDESDD